MKSGGHGAAFEEAALRLEVFAVKDLRAEVDSVRSPSVSSAARWIRRQVEAGSLVVARRDSKVLPALYEVVKERSRES